MSHALISRHPITVVPQAIRLNTERYLDGVEISAEKLYQQISQHGPYPIVEPPSVEHYFNVYKALSQETDQILSLHTSRTLSDSWANAKLAAQGLLGRCQIAVIDSQTISGALGMLVEVAAQLVQEESDLEDVERVIRGAVGRTYSIFYVETLEFIQQRGLLGQAQAMLGTMLGIKPFLTIEEGHLLTMEKVRTRSQAIDKLVEFVLEFGDIEKVAIMQCTSYPSEVTRLLQERLAAETGKRSYPTLMYGPTLASYLGIDTTGIAVLERGY